MPLKPQTCKEGETVTFTCEVTQDGVPATWFKDGVEIAPSDLVVASVDGKVHTLTLRNTSPDQAAQYTVKMKGKESSAPLTVQGLLESIKRGQRRIKNRRGRYGGDHVAYL